MRWLRPLLLSLPFCLPQAVAASVDRNEADTLVAEFAGRLSALEQRLFDDAADGRFDQFGLLEAALIASGIDDVQTLRAYQKAADKLVAELRREEKLTGSARQQAERIFEFMHRRTLGDGYHIEATDVRAAFDQGRFNCVSASVLFNHLAAECGLSVCGLETPGHAMSRVYLDDGALDVETTCPRWFRLSHDPKRQAEHVQKTLGQATKDRGPLREVTPIEMTAMIYYNRGVDLLTEKHFAEAAAANAKALRLDPASTTARGNLLATLNNWAIVEGTLQRYEQAVSLLRRGLAIEPTYATFVQNYVHVCHQWSLDLSLSGQYAEAAEMLLAAIDEQPSQPYLRQTAGDLYRRWARSRFDVGDTAGALARLDDARRRLGVTPELLGAEASEIYQWGLVLLSRDRRAAALDLFERGLQRLPDAALLHDGYRAASSAASPARSAMPDPFSPLRSQ